MRPSPHRMLRLFSILLMIGVLIAVWGNLKTVSGQLLPTPHTVAREEGSLRLVIVSPLYDHPLWKRIADGARQAGAELQVSIEYTGPRRASLDEQVELLELATASQVDGIITQGVADPRVARAISRAADRGIPVVTVDTDLPDGEASRLTYIGSDNRMAGRFAAEDLLLNTDGQAVIGIIRGDLGPEEEDLRVQAFREALEGIPTIKIVAVESTGLNRASAGTVALQMLREHPEITVIYATTAMETLGVIQSVTGLSLSRPVRVVGWDYLESDAPPGAQRIFMTVEQEPAEMGRRAVRALEGYLRRDVRPPSTDYTPFTIRTGGDRR